jgi:hypothetical protein
MATSSRHRALSLIAHDSSESCGALFRMRTPEATAGTAGFSLPILLEVSNVSILRLDRLAFVSDLRRLFDIPSIFSLVTRIRLAANVARLFILFGHFGLLFRQTTE